MTITLRATPSWAGNGVAPSWPAGTREGDIAVLLTAIYDSGSNSYFSSSLYWANRPAAWQSVTYMPDSWFDAGGNNTAGRFEAHRLTVPASTTGLLVAPTLNSPGGSRSIYQMLIVFADVGAVYQTRSGQASVTAPPYGASLATGIGLASTMTGSTALATRAIGSETVRAFWDTSTSSGYTTLGDSSQSGDPMFALSVTAAPAPSKPTIVTPAQSAGVPTGVDVDVEWQHNPGVPGGSQKAYRLRVRQDAGTWYYWNATAGTLTSTSPVTNTSTTEAATLPTAAITGASIELIVETQESADDQWSPVSDTRTFSRVAPPSVTVTGPGALSGDLTPTVTWDTTPGIGVQETYRVVFTDPSDGVLHDSGILSGATETYTAPSTTAWTSGQTVTATVTVTQTGGASATDSDDFSISWTAPTAPDVTATATAGGVVVTVTAEADRLVRVWRRHGSTDTLLGSWETGTDTTVTLTDVFGPVAAVTYVAQVWSDLDGVLLPSAQDVSSSVTRTDPGCYIASGASPVDTWQAADLETESPRTHVRPIATVYPIGADYSRTLTGTPRGRTGGFTQHATHDVTLDDVVDLLQCGDTLLVRIPPERRPDGTTGGEIIAVQVTSQIDVARFAQADWAGRVVSWSWAERAWPDPTGVTTAPVTSPVTITTPGP